MAEGLNRVMLLGNLGAEPELRVSQGGENAVLRLRLATTESYVDRRSGERKERTDWHTVVVFGKRGEALQRILTKGSSIFVEGRLQTSSYEKDNQKHYRTEVIATNVILSGRGSGAPRDEAAPRAAAPRPAGRAPQAAPAYDDYGDGAGGDPGPGPGDEDLPF